MSSNVMEWVWDDQYGREDSYGTALGGTVNTNTKFLKVNNLSPLTFDKSECAWFNGFRIARSKDGVEIGKREAKPSELIAIPGKNYEIGKTEVTQAVYESVMGENPSHFKGEDLPVESVSWYDMLYFCNEYSRLSGLTPVYAVDGKTDVKEWKYVPHKGEILHAEITMNEKANGYRLPTSEEWKYAAKGGQNFKCSGSDNVDEVAWHNDNSRGKTHPVAQKKPNGYGLYDMNGNVMECVWDSFYALGGYYSQIPKSIGIDSSTHHYKYDRFFDRGFRLARNKD
ncbi:MAG: formylglycine-generating enzyme family protein [Spirochaetaceae bacterium]|nr:formylglycine-generating enzyme family protein [Spirochaetaceae bacterium]